MDLYEAINKLTEERAYHPNWTARLIEIVGDKKLASSICSFIDDFDEWYGIMSPIDDNDLLDDIDDVYDELETRISIYTEIGEEENSKQIEKGKYLVKRLHEIHGYY